MKISPPIMSPNGSPKSSTVPSVQPPRQYQKTIDRFMKAIIEVFGGVPVEKVIQRYGLDRKGKKLNIIEKQGTDSNSRTFMVADFM